MAVTNLYYRLSRIPLNGGDPDEAFYSGATPLASGSTGDLVLKGGMYGLDAVYTGTGHIKVTGLAQDGSTAVPWNTDITGASPQAQTMYLPPGTYKITIS